jgi:hypothetical protein
MIMEIRTMNEVLSADLQNVSAMTNFSVAFLRKEIRSGRLKAKKRGTKVFVLREDLEAYLRSAPDWQDDKQEQ